MVDMKMIVIGTATWFIGYFFVLLTQWIMPPLLGVLSGTVAGIVWVGLFIFWTLALLVVPIGIKIYALQTEKEGEAIFQMATGIIYALFVWLFVIVAWYATSTLAGLMINDITLSLYWVGLISLILFDGIGVPAYFIINARKN